jgi:hypothetical protein
MMHWLEIHKPNWVACFAIAIFAGVRPDRDDGEMGKLANAIERDGAERYFRGDSLFLSADLTKDGRPRRIPIPDNLRHWLSQYPATAAALRGGTRTDYAEIRAKWKIPHDGLRHTSISACAALHGLMEAAVRHGNSEKICRDHYLALFTPEDAQKFYAIYPTPPGVRRCRGKEASIAHALHGTHSAEEPHESAQFRRNQITSSLGKSFDSASAIPVGQDLQCAP